MRHDKNSEAGVYGVSVEDEVEEAVVEFALEQVGKPYNVFLLNEGIRTQLSLQ
ncbi:MAG: hypothetical protein R6U17_02895 [Thermoplasmata archaeon]